MSVLKYYDASLENKNKKYEDDEIMNIKLSVKKNIFKVNNDNDENDCEKEDDGGDHFHHHDHHDHHHNPNQTFTNVVVDKQLPQQTRGRQRWRLLEAAVKSKSYFTTSPSGSSNSSSSSIQQMYSHQSSSSSNVCPNSATNMVINTSSTSTSPTISDCCSLSMSSSSSSMVASNESSSSTSTSTTTTGYYSSSYGANSFDSSPSTIISLSDIGSESGGIHDTLWSSIRSTATTTSAIATTKSILKQQTMQTYNLLVFEEMLSNDDNISSEDDEDYDSENGQWIVCHFIEELLQSQFSSSPTLYIRFLSPHSITLHELAGFDNSGNVRLWPCEELLAYLIVNVAPFQATLHDRVVMELGAGSTALAGLMLAKLNCVKALYLTDGNERSVANVRRIVARNFGTNSTMKQQQEIITSSTIPHVQRLRWECDQDYRNLKHCVDCIIGADCLWASGAHHALLDALDQLLVYEINCEHSNLPLPNQVYIIAPARNQTMCAFIRLVQQDGRFELQLYDLLAKTIINTLTDLTPISTTAINSTSSFITDFQLPSLVCSRIESQILEFSTTANDRVQQQQQQQSLTNKFVMVQNESSQPIQPLLLLAQQQLFTHDAHYPYLLVMRRRRVTASLCFSTTTVGKTATTTTTTTTNNPT